MTITGLAPLYRVLVPVLAEVAAGGPVDRITVRLVSGQCPADFATRAESIAHGFGVHLCRVRSAAPGLVVLELVRRDALADLVPALHIPGRVHLAAKLPDRARRDGDPRGSGPRGSSRLGRFRAGPLPGEFTRPG